MASSYWEDRAALRQAVYDRSSAQVGGIITDAHKRMLGDLREDARRIIGNFEKAFELTPTEAQALLKSPLPAKESERLRARIDEITDPAYKKAMQAKVSSGAYAHRLNRLEGIQMSAETAAIKVADVEKTVGTRHLEDTIYQGYNRTMFDIQQYTGIGFSFSGVDERRVKQILRNEWSGKSFSTRVWLNNEEMARQLSRALTERVMQGKTTRETFQALSNLSDMGRMAANRLLSTETNYIANQATAEAYDDAGIERYKFISVLDGRTSPMCQEHDGKVYSMAEKEVGKNFPPLHPWCRSTVAPEIPGFVRENMKRWSRDPETGEQMYVPADMSYNEWAKWRKDGSPSDIQTWRESAMLKPKAKQFDPIADNQGARDIFGKMDGMKYNATLGDEYVLTGKSEGKIVKVPANDTNETYIYAAPRSSGFLNGQYVPDENKNTIFTNGRIVLNDNTYNNDARLKLNSMFDNEFDILGGVRQDGVFYRTTNNPKEIEYLKAGKIRPSINHMTGNAEDGLSVWESPKYSNTITYRVKGNVISIGSDGEPILDIKSLEFIEEVNSKDLYRMRDEGRKKFAELYKWTDDQIDKAMKWNVKKKYLDV